MSNVRQVKALVTLRLDGATYEPGDTVALPVQQSARVQELLRYGLVEELPEAPALSPVKRRRSAPS